MSFQVYTYQHPDFGPLLLLVDDEPQPEIPVREDVFQIRSRNQSIKHGSNSLQKKQSLERNIKSLQRKKSPEHGMNLPRIAPKRSHLK